MDDHARFEELAVGHVLGGLPNEDAADFRGHLISCRECRLRVAELRDIAADLAAAERDEQQRARTKLDTARGVEDRARDDERVASSGSTRLPAPRRVALVTLGLLVALTVVALWSFHLRTVNAELLAVSGRQEQVMEVFAAGTTVAGLFPAETRGRIAVTSELVAVTLIDVPTPEADQRLVLWLQRGADAVAVMERRAPDPDGRLAVAVPRGGADRVVLTLEPWPADGGRTAPSGDVLVDGRLGPAGPEDTAG